MFRRNASAALLLTTSLFAVATSAQAQTAAQQDENSPAATQTGPAAPDGTIGGDIVVTGLRRANEAAITSKRAAVNIVDVVSATDVRALPDNTIVEALRRIPGLSVLPATDNEHPRDEAATPVIRGLGPSYNNVTIDGLTIASPGTPNGTLGSITRGVRLDILPSSMVSEIDVVKTFTADLDPNATGGAINLRTRSAFEGSGRPFFTAEASLGHANDTGKPRDQDDPGYRLIATGSTTFGAAHQFGLTVAANYQTLSSYTETHMTTDTVHYSFYNAAGILQSGTNLGNGYAVPQQDKYWYVMDKRDRYGITAKFEARIAQNLSAYAMGGFYYFKDNMERNEVIIDPRNRGTVFNQTATSGTYPVGDVEVGYSNQITTTRTRVAQTGFDWQPDDRQSLSGRASWSRATYDEPIQMIKYITGASRPAPVATTTTGAGVTVVPTSAYGFNYDTSGFNQRFPIAASAYENYANYSLLYWRPDYKRSAGDEVYTGRLDYSFNQRPQDQGVGFATGLAYTDDRPYFNIYRDEFQPNSSAPALGIADVLSPSNAIMPYLGLNLIAIDPTKAFAQARAAPRSAFNATDQYVFSNQDNFTHTEKLFGAYALASYRSDRLSAQAGLRYDDTHQSTVGRQRQLDPASNTYVYVDKPTGSSYRYLLPSGIFTFHATDLLDLRGAVSRTLGRPPYDAYAARTSISFVNPNDQGNPNATGVTVTIGNPDIKPRLSTNLDLDLDRRIPGFDGLVSLAGFYKWIDNEIFTLTNVGPYSFNGTTYATAAVSTPGNAANARIRGVEGSVILNTLRPVAPLLAGFGVAANAALLGGQLTVPYSLTGTTVTTRQLDHLVGQPSYTANATVFYNARGLELRAAFNRQGKALRSIVSNIGWQDLYWAPRSQLDLSATYALRHGVSVFGQVSNVTHTRITSLVGPGQNLLKDSYSVPTVFWLGIRITPKL